MLNMITTAAALAGRIRLRPMTLATSTLRNHFISKSALRIERATWNWIWRALCQAPSGPSLKQRGCTAKRISEMTHYGLHYRAAM